jgi:hypothetical protein
MMAVSYGTRTGGKIPRMLSILAQVSAPNHYKELFVCAAHSVPNSPQMPSIEAETAVYEDNYSKYVDKIMHQKKRGYFMIPKDLEQDELQILNRVAIYSIIENTKKTEKYYCDLLECSRMVFKDKYRNILEMFCEQVDNQLHNIEKQARELM